LSTIESECGAFGSGVRVVRSRFHVTVLHHQAVVTSASRQPLIRQAGHSTRMTPHLNAVDEAAHRRRDDKHSADQQADVEALYREVLRAERRCTTIPFSNGHASAMSNS